MTIKIGAMQAEIAAEETQKDFFEVDIDSSYRFMIANTGGEYSVYNAMDGWGNNCYDEFKNETVTIAS